MNQRISRDGDVTVLESHLADAIKAYIASRMEEDSIDEIGVNVMEMATIVGLLQRLKVSTPQMDWVLSRVEELVQFPTEVRIPEIVLDFVQDGLVAFHDESDNEEILYFLFSIDELCAGLTVLGSTDGASTAADFFERTVSAFPEMWISLAPIACTLMERCPPVEGDPALGIWKAIAGAPKTAEINEERENAEQGPSTVSAETLQRLGLLFN